MNGEYLLKLYYNPKTRKYYYTGKAVCCECGKYIEHILLFNAYFTKLGSGIRTFCLNCLKKVNFIGYIMEIKLAVVTQTPPEGSFPIFITRPVLTNAGFTTIDLAVKHIPGVVVKDRTRLACRLSFEDLQIGRDISDVVFLKDWWYITESQMNCILDFHKNAAPVIGGGKTKLLGRKRS